MSINQSIAINDKIIKPIELVLNGSSDLDSNGAVKNPLEIFVSRVDDNEKAPYISRKFTPSDGLIYYLDQKPIRVEKIEDKKIKLRKLRMLVCVTMYNEDRELLNKTLEGIHDNLAAFCMASVCPEDIAVVVISDGIQKMHSSVINYLRELDEQMRNPELSIDKRQKEIDEGCKIYLEEAKNDPKERQKREGEVHSKSHIPVAVAKKTAICYQTRLTSKNFEGSKFKNTNLGEKKLNVFFTVKIMNKGKLSSHLWFFQGFCKTFNPDYCTVLDCGTKPEKEGIFNFFRALEAEPDIGGVCGYMGARMEVEPEDEKNRKKSQQPFEFKVDPNSFFLFKLLPKFFNVFFYVINVAMVFLEYIFSIEKAQKFEYAFAHIFDKAFESFFGFISVLPGAWSAYRWDALTDDNLLEKEYFKTVLEPDYVFKTIKEANKILAEDRLLCLAIFTKKNNKYILKYCPDAVARTDLVNTIPGLLSQRKRWINGTWYALEHVIHYKNLIRYSKHSYLMRLMFDFSILMSKIGMYIIYLMMASYYITLNIVMFAFFDNIRLVDSSLSSLAGFLVFLYIWFIISLLYLSIQLKSNDADAEFFFRLISHVMGIFMLFSFAVTLILLFGEIFSNPTGYFMDQNLMRILSITNAVSYVVIALVNPFSLDTISFCVLHYLYYMPTYLHIMVVYAFCRIDDLSWGTKGSYDTEENNKSKEYKDFKVNFVTTWLLVNAFMSYVVIVLISEQDYKDIFLTILISFITALVALKSFFAFLYQMKYLFYDLSKYKRTLEKNAPIYHKQGREIIDYYDKLKIKGFILNHARVNRGVIADVPPEFQKKTPEKNNGPNNGLSNLYQSNIMTNNGGRYDYDVFGTMLKSKVISTAK